MKKMRPDNRIAHIREMFTQIAHHYDRMNRLMTAGQDINWRIEAVTLISLPENGYLLDIGTGTGDLAYQAWCLHPECTIVAGDYNMEMIRVGKSRFHHFQSDLPSIEWCGADGLTLPFHEETFDAVICGFLLRNVENVSSALQEQHRVLKQGGQIVILDTTHPPQNWRRSFIQVYLRFFIPLLGFLIARQPGAYGYLSASTNQFLSAEELAMRIRAANFRNVCFKRKMLGLIAIHWAEK